ncbi:hypothetical protein UFOVP276_236 [uncultured Caudovirales phage]|uniref:Uncharacterized protein n=1 Tax=uncultured Caudovirales phage TaxID=2100421 RepID=A0A6J5LDS4_9CAUD|nr:hypothetical protein UFOVP127_130 [uncultured Caudovirales phage]CAB4135280.1 hypothetical protein UFOVP276_236 [uncultured Caudovirales phage]
MAKSELARAKKLLRRKSATIRILAKEVVSLRNQLMSLCTCPYSIVSRSCPIHKQQALRQDTPWYYY